MEPSADVPRGLGGDTGNPQQAAWTREMLDFLVGKPGVPRAGQGGIVG